MLEPELAKVLNVLFNVNAPETDRTDIVQAVLQGIPDLNEIEGAPQVEGRAAPDGHAQAEPWRAAEPDAEPFRGPRR